MYASAASAQAERKVKICTRYFQVICLCLALRAVSIMWLSALRFCCIYLTQQSAKAAIAFERRQMVLTFLSSWPPPPPTEGPSSAKGPLDAARDSVPLQVVCYSGLHLISGQRVDSRSPRLIHPHFSRQHPRFPL